MGHAVHKVSESGGVVVEREAVRGVKGGIVVVFEELYCAFVYVQKEKSVRKNTQPPGYDTKQS